MSKRVLVGAFALMLIALTVHIASAQFPSPHPYIAVYFGDWSKGIEAKPPSGEMGAPCPGVGVFDTLSVVLHNANQFVSAVEFCIEYPLAITWFADFNHQPVKIGQSPCSDPSGGVSMGWGSPQNGWKPIFIMNVLVQWNCWCCQFPYLNNRIIVRNKQTSPSEFPRFTGFPDPILYEAIGLTSLICTTIATEESTWGKVKALYSD